MVVTDSLPNGRKHTLLRAGSDFPHGSAGRKGMTHWQKHRTTTEPGSGCGSPFNNDLQISSILSALCHTTAPIDYVVAANGYTSRRRAACPL